MRTYNDIKIIGIDFPIFGDMNIVQGSPKEAHGYSKRVYCVLRNIVPNKFTALSDIFSKKDPHPLP
jgi:hypothetical protein